MPNSEKKQTKPSCAFCSHHMSMTLNDVSDKPLHLPGRETALSTTPPPPAPAFPVRATAWVRT